MPILIVSTRRKPGEIVWKRANAGFTGVAGRAVIAPDSEHVKCVLDCGDPDCREWLDLWPIAADGYPIGTVWYHVSECEMDDDPDKGRL